MSGNRTNKGGDPEGRVVGFPEARRRPAGTMGQATQDVSRRLAETEGESGEARALAEKAFMALPVESRERIVLNAREAGMDMSFLETDRRGQLIESSGASLSRPFPQNLDSTISFDIQQEIVSFDISEIASDVRENLLNVIKERDEREAAALLTVERDEVYEEGCEELLKKLRNPNGPLALGLPHIPQPEIDQFLRANVESGISEYVDRLDLLRKRYVDAKTNVYLYPFLQLVLDKFCAEKIPFALIGFDIKKMKSLNKVIGYEAVDRVLKDIFQVLSKLIRKNDIATSKELASSNPQASLSLARKGGDEGLMGLKNVSDPETAWRIIQRFQDTLRQPRRTKITTEDYNQAIMQLHMKVSCSEESLTKEERDAIDTLRGVLQAVCRELDVDVPPASIDKDIEIDLPFDMRFSLIFVDPEEGEDTFDKDKYLPRLQSIENNAKVVNGGARLPVVMEDAKGKKYVGALGDQFLRELDA